MLTAFALVCLTPGKLDTACVTVAVSCLAVGSVEEMPCGEQSLVILVSGFELKCAVLASQQKSPDVLQDAS